MDLPKVVARDKRGVKLAERICRECGVVELVRWYRLRDNPTLLCNRCSTSQLFSTHGLTNCPYRRFMRRMEQGWSMEKIMTTPIKRGDSGARLYN